MTSPFGTLLEALEGKFNKLSELVDEEYHTADEKRVRWRYDFQRKMIRDMTLAIILTDIADSMQTIAGENK